eukprot:7337657-Alexandrium_andersonii.AAC.1
MIPCCVAVAILFGACRWLTGACTLPADDEAAQGAFAFAATFAEQLILFTGCEQRKHALEFGISEAKVHNIGEYCSSNFGTCTVSPGVRTWNCTGPGVASKLLPEAPE